MNLSFSADNGAVDAAINSLIELAGSITQRSIVREMILAALKAGQENPPANDLKIMCSTLKEMRYTSKIFGGYRGIRKVTVFGSARTASDDPIYDMAREFGRHLAGKGFMVITGGGPGIMQAANEGAGQEKSFGVSIRLPLEQKTNPVMNGSPRDITYKYFFNRKIAFIKEACAVALFPGGFGTLDEAMETLTLLQTGKRYPIPVLLLEQAGGAYWSDWTKFLKTQLTSAGYIGPNDFTFFHHTHDMEEAIDIIKGFYRRYHSMRFVDDKTVVRMTSGLEAAQIQVLKRRFADILVDGGDIVQCEALPKECNEPELARLPRLVIDFNKLDFARLRQFIDLINSFARTPGKSEGNGGLNHLAT